MDMGCCRGAALAAPMRNPASTTPIGHKRIGIGVAVVGREIFPHHLFPHSGVYRGEKGIGIGKIVVYLGDVELPGIVDGSLV